MDNKKEKRKLGIWLDHAMAHVIEPKESFNSNIITSKFNKEEREISLSRSEKTMHQKEQHQQAEYYKQLIDIIRNYNSVLIFGPGEAKNELTNLIKEDHRFDQIQIETVTTDNMPPNEKVNFVIAHFSKNNVESNSK
jgi:stalled ribosome rescue protein Dom34